MGMNAQAPLSSYNKTTQFRRSKPGQTESDFKHKFMQTIGDEMFSELEKIADEKGIRVQTLLRAVVIPEWVQRKGQSMDPRSNPHGAQTSYRVKHREDRPQEF
jgi:hypothetical protein